MENPIKNQFDTKAFEIYELAKKLCGYNATRFLQKIKRDGGVRAAKTWLDPKNKDQPPTSGFLKLIENGRPDISPEALVLRDPWKKLFSDEELSVASTRLEKFGYNGIELKNEISDSLIPEEIPINEVFNEGYTLSIKVNSYERNREARQRGIEYYGSVCCICKFNFEVRYGKNFKDFIHVHHLRPLATIAESYVLNPIKDLRPICPNCHAIIHRKNPPYTVPEMKKMIKDPNKLF